MDPEQVRIVEEVEETEADVKEFRSRVERREMIEVEACEALPRYNADRHIFLADAKQIKNDAELDEELEFPLESHSDFGRIAAQTVKQVVLQNIRDAERASVQEEFAGRQGEIVSGIVQRFDRGNVYVDLGRAIGVMFHGDGLPGEHYRVVTNAVLCRIGSARRSSSRYSA